MKDFKEYYHSHFRQDINRFFSTIPDESRFHEDRENKQIFSIQFDRLKPRFQHLSFLNREEKECFGIALFQTILTDMVCYTHFQSHYNAFSEKTRYPKFIGNCLAMCHYHLHPTDIFRAMNFRWSAKEEYLVFPGKFFDAVETMKEEILSFFDQHLPGIDGGIFWEMCRKEFPYKPPGEKSL